MKNWSKNGYIVKTTVNAKPTTANLLHLQPNCFPLRLIKLAIISFVILFAVVTAISLLIPAHIRISKAVNVVNKKDSVFTLIRNRDRWSQWHPAFVSEEGRRQMKAFSFQLKKNSDSLVVWEMVLPNKRAIDNGFQIYTYPNADSLTLQWYMDFHLPWYPWQKFGSLFYENTYGVLMESGLSNIRKQVE